MARTINSDKDAQKAPVGTVVFLFTNGNSGEPCRVIAQKHDSGWFIATAWEGSCFDKEIRGEVLVWGEQQPKKVRS
jgi:hypothetical protein